MTNESPTKPWAIIVGAGPSGLILALMLAKKGVPVHLVDMGSKLDEKPRATHYSAPANHELRRAGVLDEVQEEGFIPDGVCWRKLDGTCLAGMSNRIMPNRDDSLVCLPLPQLGRILLRHLLEQPMAKIFWKYRVENVGQDGESAWIDVQTESGLQRLHAEYVIGCDGANSQVRRSLFGRNFPGFTWEEQIVATNTYYPFEKYGFRDANFIIHPEHWYMAARISKDGLWRITYGEEKGLTWDELVARQPMKFEKFLPGHEKPELGAWKLASISPYKVHQRLVEKMRVGRICLAADAAHLCNPFGGLGLTGGLVDIGNLYDCLIGIYENKADESILDKYDEIRRKMYNEVINPVSQENIRRLFGQNPDMALEKDEFLQMCRKGENDVEFARQFQSGIKCIMHDFTQYYDKK